MSPEIRIKTIFLIKKIKKDREYAGKLNVVDISHYKTENKSPVKERED